MAHVSPINYVEDRRLVARLLAGDETAFKQFFTDHDGYIALRSLERAATPVRLKTQRRQPYPAPWPTSGAIEERRSSLPGSARSAAVS